MSEHGKLDELDPVVKKDLKIIKLFSIIFLLFFKKMFKYNLIRLLPFYSLLSCIEIITKDICVRRERDNCSLFMVIRIRMSLPNVSNRVIECTNQYIKSKITIGSKVA